MKEFICSWIWSEDKKKENRIRLSWQGIDLLLGFGPRICLWLDWAREQKKRKETAFVLSWQRISFVVGFGTRTKKKERKLHPFYRAQEFILRFDLAREHEKRKETASVLSCPKNSFCV